MSYLFKDKDDEDKMVPLEATFIEIPAENVLRVVEVPSEEADERGLEAMDPDEVIEIVMQYSLNTAITLDTDSSSAESPNANQQRSHPLGLAHTTQPASGVIPMIPLRVVRPRRPRHSLRCLRFPGLSSRSLYSSCTTSRSIDNMEHSSYSTLHSSSRLWTFKPKWRHEIERSIIFGTLLSTCRKARMLLGQFSFGGLLICSSTLSDSVRRSMLALIGPATTYQGVSMRCTPWKTT